MNTIVLRFIAVMFIAILFTGCTTVPSPSSRESDNSVTTRAAPSTPETKSISMILSQDLVMLSDAAECPKASAYLPMAPRGTIENPSVLAERIEAALRKDPTGQKAQVRGTNATPEQYLQAVQVAGGTVDGIGALPMYLRSLVSSNMPEGTIRMSRIAYTKKDIDDRCLERYALDVTEGYARSGMDGEQGWYDANTGRLILAENCTNSPIYPIRELTTAPAPTVSETPITCVPNTGEGHNGNIYFPSVADFPAWEACNKGFKCSSPTECEYWVANDMSHGASIRRITGQRVGMTLALKNPPMRPAVLHGETVVCWKGTDRYWTLMPDSTVVKGIKSEGSD